MHTLDVAPGVHRISRAATACYVVEDGDRLLLIDAGLPAFWSDLVALLKVLGREIGDVDHVLLTHGHFDHVGIARRVQRESGATVWVDHGDVRIAARPYRYRPGRPRSSYPLRFPASWRHLGAMALAGALRVHGVDDPRTYDELLPFGGLFTVVPTPGHTVGHVAIHLPDRDAVVTGDALVTLDPYTGRVGPRIVAQAGTYDAPTAWRSLTAIAETHARIVLPGHGEVWTQGAEAAVAEALPRTIP